MKQTFLVEDLGKEKNVHRLTDSLKTDSLILY